MRLEPTSELISAYVDGELTADEQSVVEQAMRDDPDVRRMHDELRALRFTLQLLPRYEPEQDLTERILRQAERTMLGGGDLARPGTHDEESAKPVPPAELPPTVAMTSDPWRSWSVAISVIGTLAALVLFVLWLPKPADQFGVARSTMPGKAGVESEAASEEELLREEFRFDDRSDLELRELEDEAAGSEPADKRTDSFDSLALKRNRSLGRGRAMEGAIEDSMMGDADASPATSALDTDSLKAVEESAMSKDGAMSKGGMAPKGGMDSKAGTVTKGGGASNTEFFYQAESLQERVAGQEPAESNVGAFGAQYGSTRSRFTMPERQLGLEAVEFQLADKQQLINRFETEQLLYVQLDVSSSDTQWTEGSSMRWLDEKLRSPLSGGISVQGVLLGEALGTTDGRDVAGGELVVAEGSADQIRAALTTLSGLDGVEVKLAKSSPNSWYGRFRPGSKLGFPAEPDASRTAPLSSDFVESEGYQETAPVADTPGKPAILPPAANSPGQQRGESGMRRQRSRGFANDSGASGQSMPGGMGGGGMGSGRGMPGMPGLAGRAPAAPASDPATRRANVIPKLEQSLDPKLMPEEMKESAKEALEKNAAESERGGGARLAKKMRGTAAEGDNPFGVSPNKEKAQKPAREAASTATPVRDMGDLADKPGAEPAVQVAKPRLVRILFRVRPPTVDAQAAQEAAQTDEPTVDSGKDPDKSPEMEK